jgi:beta-glucanase (GH16 family)
MFSKKSFLLLLLWVLIISCKAQVLWQIKKDTVIKWHYYDGDEFNGPSVDLAKWIPAYSYSQMNYKFAYLMSPKRLEFENGICKFMCYRDTGLYTVPPWHLDETFEKNHSIKLLEGNKVQYFFTAGNVWSKQQYGKGYFEIRFKATDSYGMWPAFWMYGNNQKDEIDFFELKGERNNEIHIDVHCPRGCGSRYKGGSLFPRSFGGWIKLDQFLKDDYNVVSAEWQDGYVAWFLNGEGIGYFKGDFESQKMNLIIGTGPAKDGFAFAPGVNEKSTFPNSLDVDYVRVWYKQPGDTSEIMGKKHRKFSYHPTDDKLKAEPRKKIRFMYNKKELDKLQLTISVLPAENKSIIVNSFGKTIDYKISISDLSGKELHSEQISAKYITIPLTNKTNEKSVKVKITMAQKTLEEIIPLH